jgi:Uma2 family endonuclease
MLDIQRPDIALTDDRQFLPSGSDLPDSDNIPVDNENQNWIPNVLLMLLQNIWDERQDWYFGVDMGIYHTTGRNVRVPIVPDGFLSLGVERQKNNRPRRSYVVWEEEDIAPILTLEIVSWTPGGEYDDKKSVYANLGVLYYVVYNPEFWQRDGHQPLEIYKLIDGNYELQSGEPLWMPEIGLGIGRCPEIFSGAINEVLSWFDERGDRYLRPEEKTIEAQEEAAQAQRSAALAQEETVQAQRNAALAQEETVQAQRSAALAQEETVQAQRNAALAQEETVQAQARALKLAAKLQKLGINPDEI